MAVKSYLNWTHFMATAQYPLHSCLGTVEDFGWEVRGRLVHTGLPSLILLLLQGTLLFACLRLLSHPTYSGMRIDKIIMVYIF